MKIKILKYLFLTAILGIALWSCKKDESTSSTNPITFESSHSNSGFDKTQRRLNNSEIYNIGADHNFYLSQLLEGVVVTSPNRFSVLKQNMVQLDPNLANHNEDLDVFINYSKTNSDLVGFNSFVDLNSDYFNDPASLKAYVYNSTVLLSNCSDYSLFESLLVQLETSAQSELEGIDLDTYLVFASVFKSSVSFWTSDENDFFDFPSQKTLGERVAQADGLSAAVGFVTLAFVTAGVSAATAATGGTGTVGAIAIVGSLLGIGFSSACSSVLAILIS